MRRNGEDAAVHEVPPVPPGLENGYMAFQDMPVPRDKGVRNKWSRIQVSLSTMKRTFKETFPEALRQEHYMAAKSCYKDQVMHEVDNEGNLTTRALEYQKSQEWLENERKADAEDPDDGIYESEIHVSREHEHRPKPAFFRLPKEYKNDWGRLLPQIKKPVTFFGPNLYKFIRTMDDFFVHQEMEELQKDHHIKSHCKVF